METYFLGAKLLRNQANFTRKDLDIQKYKKQLMSFSVLSSRSKVSERPLLKQVLPFTEKRLSAVLYAFKKGHSTQRALFRVVEMVRRCIDKGGCHCHDNDGPFKSMRLSAA